MRTTEERKTARDLRKQGWSIKQIERHLGIARSTASVWVRDIELTQEQIRVLSDRKAVQYAYVQKEAIRKSEEARIKRDAYSEEGKTRCKDDISFRVICALYWGEGTKHKNSFIVTNCSPDMLRVIGDWLVKEGFLNRIRFNIGYHVANGITEDEIKAYWMGHLKWLSLGHINKMTKCVINRASQKKRIGKQPFGTARICVHDTKLASMVRGGIEYIKGTGL
jgi:hypothetical protein